MTGVAEEDGVSEALLLRQARNGDAKSFESLYRRHEGRVYALCLRMTRSPERAEDSIALCRIVFGERFVDYSALNGDGAVPAGSAVGVTNGPDADAIIERAFRDRRGDFQVEGAGTVARVLADDNDGSRHQAGWIEHKGKSYQ